MIKRSLLAVTAVILSQSVQALPADVVLHEMVRYTAPLITAKFRVDYKKNEPYVSIMVQEDVIANNSEDPFAVEAYGLRADLDLTLQANGDIVYTSELGESVVCAKVVRKKFLGIPYRRVKATGTCEFYTVLSPLGNGRVKASLEMSFRE